MKICIDPKWNLCSQEHVYCMLNGVTLSVKSPSMSFAEANCEAEVLWELQRSQYKGKSKGLTLSLYSWTWAEINQLIHTSPSPTTGSHLSQKSWCIVIGIWVSNQVTTKLNCKLPNLLLAQSINLCTQQNHQPYHIWSILNFDYWKIDKTFATPINKHCASQALLSMANLAERTAAFALAE